MTIITNPLNKLSLRRRDAIMTSCSRSVIRLYFLLVLVPWRVGVQMKSMSCSVVFFICRVLASYVMQSDFVLLNHLYPCLTSFFSLVNSGVFDDDVGSQDFLERLCASRGLDSSILYSEDFKDGASDIENAEFMPESQKPELYGSSPPPMSSKLVSVYQINVDEHGIELIEVKEETSDFCPHSTTACPCAAWLLEQYFQLTRCLAREREENEQLVATNFRQRVRLERTRDVLQKTVGALNLAQKDVEEACTTQNSMEERLKVANSVRQDVLSRLHGQF
ncbi:hypothetical protein F5051DRAFT_414700 [Lentinula edodes]|nr:hypothetical protein F5051DRAFT_414700 [Lentinula edodes]